MPTPTEAPDRELLLRRLKQFSRLGYPLLAAVNTSRKLLSLQAKEQLSAKVRSKRRRYSKHNFRVLKPLKLRRTAHVGGTRPTRKI